MEKREDKMGSRDKAKRETKKEKKLSIKEKRKLKREKNQ